MPIYFRSKGICGPTRELVVAIVANIESRELWRRQYERRQLIPEHPRASSSDDVEGFFFSFAWYIRASLRLKATNVVKF